MLRCCYVELDMYHDSVTICRLSILKGSPEGGDLHILSYKSLQWLLGVGYDKILREAK